MYGNTEHGDWEIPWSSVKQTAPESLTPRVPPIGDPPLVSVAQSPQSASVCDVGTHETVYGAMDSSCGHCASLSGCALWRLTGGKSRIWEICTFGSVRGVRSDPHPYRDYE
jgi:hypothetical protein